MKDFFKQIWAFAKARLNDIIQLFVAGGAVGAAAPYVVDDVSFTTAAAAAVIGRLAAYVKLVPSKE